MKKNNRNTVRRMLATLMIMVWATIAAVPAFAAPKVKKAEYEGKGRVEVDFNSKVKYKNVKVTVKDNKGAAYSTKINEKDNDDLAFTIKNFKTGRTYTYTISGIKKSNESSYGKVTGKVTIPTPSTTPRVKEVDYDKKDKEVEFERQQELCDQNYREGQGQYRSQGQQTDHRQEVHLQDFRCPCQRCQQL